MKRVKIILFFLGIVSFSSSVMSAEMRDELDDKELTFKIGGVLRTVSESAIQKLGLIRNYCDDFRPENSGEFIEHACKPYSPNLVNLLFDLVQASDDQVSDFINSIPEEYLFKLYELADFFDLERSIFLELQKRCLVEMVDCVRSIFPEDFSKKLLKTPSFIRLLKDISTKEQLYLAMILSVNEEHKFNFEKNLTDKLSVEFLIKSVNFVRNYFSSSMEGFLVVIKTLMNEKEFVERYKNGSEEALKSVALALQEGIPFMDLSGDMYCQRNSKIKLKEDQMPFFKSGLQDFTAFSNDTYQFNDTYELEAFLKQHFSTYHIVRNSVGCSVYTIDKKDLLFSLSCDDRITINENRNFCFLEINKGDKRRCFGDIVKGNFHWINNLGYTVLFSQKGDYVLSSDRSKFKIFSIDNLLDNKPPCVSIDSKEYGHSIFFRPQDNKVLIKYGDQIFLYGSNVLQGRFTVNSIDNICIQSDLFFYIKDQTMPTVVGQSMENPRFSATFTTIDQSTREYYYQRVKKLVLNVDGSVSLDYELFNRNPDYFFDKSDLIVKQKKKKWDMPFRRLKREECEQLSPEQKALLYYFGSTQESSQVELPHIFKPLYNALPETIKPGYNLVPSPLKHRITKGAKKVLNLVKKKDKTLPKGETDQVEEVDQAEEIQEAIAAALQVEDLAMDQQCPLHPNEACGCAEAVESYDSEDQPLLGDFL